MLELYFFNVGHGDSIAVKFPNGEWGVIDCNRNKNEKDPNVLKFLKKNKVQHLKFLAISHYHEDHFKGIDIIAEYFKDNIDNLILPSVCLNSKLGTNNLTSLIKAIKLIVTPKMYQRLTTIEDGNKYNVGDIQISLLNPNTEIVKKCYAEYFNGSDIKILNKESIVMSFVYAGKQILLTGDVTHDVWENIFKEYGKISADVIKISHHGSKENNPDELLHILAENSCISVISSDGNKKYDVLPSADVLNCLQKNKKSCVLKTYSLNTSNGNEKTTNLKGDKVIKGIMKNKNSNQYDGYFKVTIAEGGEISTEVIQHV